LQRAESPSRQPGIELLLPGSSVIASGKERDEQEGPPGVFRCVSDATRVVSMLAADCTPKMRKRSGSDATRTVSMLAEDCTPKMRKRSGSSRVGMVSARVSASGIAINP